MPTRRFNLDLVEQASERYYAALSLARDVAYLLKSMSKCDTLVFCILSNNRATLAFRVAFGEAFV